MPAGKSDRRPITPHTSVAFETVPHGRPLATPPGPRAIGTCRCRSTGQRRRARELGPQPLRTPACVARADLLRVGNFAPFSEILHIKGLNFPDVFYPFKSTHDPYNHAKFRGNRSARFFRNPEHRHTQTDAATLYIIYRRDVVEWV